MAKKPHYHRWYGLARWKKLRRSQLRKDPLCAMCKAEGFVRAANVVDHITAHKGNEVLFWDPDNLQSLCKRHHDSDKQRFEKGGTMKRAIGPGGWPV